MLYTSKPLEFEIADDKIKIEKTIYKIHQSIPEVVEEEEDLIDNEEFNNNKVRFEFKNFRQRNFQNSKLIKELKLLDENDNDENNVDEDEDDDDDNDDDNDDDDDDAAVAADGEDDERLHR